MNKLAFSTLTIAASLILGSAASRIAHAQPEQDWVRTETRDDCLDYDPLRKPLFGDTHVHTSYSMDAKLFQSRTGPRDAYDFAKGGYAVDLPPYDAMDNPWRTYTINRPLDFTVVTEHAEQIGEVSICFDNSYAGYSTPLCTNLRNWQSDDFGPPGPIPPILIQWIAPLAAADPMRNTDICGATNADCAAAAGFIWQDLQDAAEEHYDRSDACSFTTFNGYEFTASVGQDNLHRNVIFRNEVVPALPFSAFESQNAEDLFDHLDSDCMGQANGCDALTITHNANVSQGRMFQNTMFDESPMTPAYAEQRARIEPLTEIIQHKAASECKLGWPSSDEECRFESSTRIQPLGVSNPGQVFQPLSFARDALKEGFALKAAIGTNPFEIGFVGSTDTHNSSPGAVNEEDFATHGALGAADRDPEWKLANFNINGIEANAGGLAVVYAEENSRDAIFAAMKRRETYATSGPRITARFFGGRIPKDICDQPDINTIGYNRGVPMGGEIGTVKGKKSPSFVVTASKDPGGNGDPSTQLQRIEIIKAWVDSDGVRQEQVVHAAGTKAKQSDAGVDLDTCTPTGTGHDTLCAFWTDKSFDATEDASYYARIIENPVCRWTQYICNDNGVDCSDFNTFPGDLQRCCNTFDEYEQTIQERAWTSPIFYIPENTAMEKAQIKYGKNGGDDKMKLSATVGRLDPDFDITANDLTLVLRDDDEFFNVTIPAGTFTPVGNGTKFKYKDAAGSLGGIKTALFKTSATKANQLKISTVAMDLSAADQSSHKVEFEVSIGSYQSVDESEWVFDGKKLAVPK